MIIDTIKNIHRYAALGPNFAKAAAWLSETDLNALTEPRIEVDGTNVYAMVQEPVLDHAEERYEAHEKYADIQLLLSGEERYGWSRAESIGPMDPARDICFGPAQTDVGFVLRPEQFAIFLPGEAHAPCCMVDKPAKCRKIVVKVRCAD